jgi:outer membrane protein assembly factor BamB
MRRLPLAIALTAVPALLAAGCGGAGSPAAQTPLHTSAHVGSGQQAGHRGIAFRAAATTTNHLTTWPTYHRTNGRSGVAIGHVTLPLHHAWTANLDGSVYGEPLVVDDTLIVATENDSVYGLNPANGAHRWRTHLATPESQSDIGGCGDVFPLGITGTPAYDAKTGSVFVVAESLDGHHTLWALNARNGHRRWHHNMDVLPSRDRRMEQQRSALLVAHGRVYTTYGGLYGDCGNYVGYITSTATTGKGTTHHYAVPTAREAGMWSTEGPVEGANGNIYVASGNGAEVSGRWDKSDSVTELTPTTLRRIAVFAPSSWKQDNIDDLDLGSSSPVPVNGRIVIAGKRGVVYLLRESLGGVGHSIKSLGGCTAFGGAAHLGNTALMPCQGSGVSALRVGKSSLHWAWQSGVYGSPVIAGSRVYVATGGSPGRLDVLSLSTGHVVAGIATGPLPHFPSEVVDGNLIFVPTLTGITAIRGS